MFVEGKSITVFFPSDTIIHGISRDSSKNYNIRTCEHMILGQLRMGARQTNYAPLLTVWVKSVLVICRPKLFIQDFRRHIKTHIMFSEQRNIHINSYDR